MSWNWNEERERKEYETKGTVTIGTDEYRDLIEEVEELRAAGQKEHDDWYKEYRRADDLEKKVKNLEKKIEEFNKWLSLYPTNAEEFREWKFRKIAEQEEAENE